MKFVFLFVVFLLAVTPLASAGCLPVDDILLLNNLSVSSGQNSSAVIAVFERICLNVESSVLLKANQSIDVKSVQLSAQINQTQLNLSNLSSFVANFSSNFSALFVEVSNISQLRSDLITLKDIKTILTSDTKFSDIETGFKRNIEDVRTSLQQDIDLVRKDVKNISLQPQIIQQIQQPQQDTTIWFAVAIGIIVLLGIVFTVFGGGKKLLKRGNIDFALPEGFRPSPRQTIQDFQLQKSRKISPDTKKAVEEYDMAFMRKQEEEKKRIEEMKKTAKEISDMEEMKRGRR